MVGKEEGELPEGFLAEVAVEQSLEGQTQGKQENRARQEHKGCGGGGQA